MRRDVQEIFRMTPHEKQVMMFSATLSKEIRPVCRKFMQDVNTLLPSLPPLPARCLLPFRALFLQTPLSFKRQEGGMCPPGSDDSLKRHIEAETASVRVCAGARETPEDLVGLTWERVVFDFFFWITAFLNLFSILGEGRIFCPTTHLLHTPYSHAPSRWHRAFNWSLLLPKTQPPGGRRAREGQTDGRACPKEEQTAQMNPLPPHVQGWGPLAPQSPVPCTFPPVPPRTHPEPRLMWAGSREAPWRGGGNADGTRRWMAAAEAAGKPAQEAEDQTSLFFCSWFFSWTQGVLCSPFPPICVGGRGVLNGVVDFFSFFKHFFNTQRRGIWER